MLALAPLVLAIVVTKPYHYTADVHGTIVQRDAAKQRVVVRHTPHPGMNYDMRVLVRVEDRAQFRRLRTGEHVDLRCDERAALPVCEVRSGG